MRLNQLDFSKKGSRQIRHRSLCTMNHTRILSIALSPGLVASLHLRVAQPARGVHVLDARGPHQSLHKVLLLGALEADHVHAHLAAVVATGEPVPAGVAQLLLVAGPRHPVALAAKVEVAH